MSFTKAKRTDAYLRLGLIGPAGSGKTATALILAKLMGCKKIAVIDTEGGRASEYVGRAFPEHGITGVEFDVDRPTLFHPDEYVARINDAVKCGYDCLVIDSLSHEYIGEGGLLQIVDENGEQGKKTFTSGWKVATPMHQRFLTTLISSKIHLICTMRAKTEYVLETRNGKQVPRKIGLGPVQRDGTDHEFSVLGMMDMDNTMTVAKSTYGNIPLGKEYPKPGAELAKLLSEWLNRDVVQPVATPAAVVAAGTSPTPAKRTPPVASDEMTDAEAAAILETAKIPVKAAPITASSVPTGAGVPVKGDSKAGDASREAEPVYVSILKGNGGADDLRHAAVGMLHAKGTLKPDQGLEDFPPALRKYIEDAPSAYRDYCKVHQLMVKDPAFEKNATAWLIEQKRLKPGQTWHAIVPQMAAAIAAGPEKFQKAIATWVAAKAAK